MWWVDSTSPVSRATMVTSDSSTMARTRRRAWAAPMRQVMQPAGPAQGDRALPVGDVVAQPEVARSPAPGRVCLRSRPVGFAGCDPPDGPVWPFLVVGEAEGIELRLQLGEGPRRGLLSEPALEGLVEALDLALGLGMAGSPVLLADAQVGEEVLEAVASAGEARGVDGTVVGERGGGPAVDLARGAERGHHVVTVDPSKGRAAEQVAGVVIEPRADLDLGPVRQAPVGHVGLPELVGGRCLEAQP